MNPESRCCDVQDVRPAYRLSAAPTRLPRHYRSAEVLDTLSRMHAEPMTLDALVQGTRLRGTDVIGLLKELGAQQCLLVQPYAPAAGSSATR